MNQAVAAFLVLALIGACMVAAGVFVLLGTGWALCVAGLEFLAAAAFVKIGLNRAGDEAV